MVEIPTVKSFLGYFDLKVACTAIAGLRLIMSIIVVVALLYAFVIMEDEAIVASKRSSAVETSSKSSPVEAIKQSSLVEATNKSSLVEASNQSSLVKASNQSSIVEATNKNSAVEPSSKNSEVEPSNKSSGVVATESADSGKVSYGLIEFFIAVYITIAIAVATINLVSAYWFIQGITSNKPAKMKYYLYIEVVVVILLLLSFKIASVGAAAIECYIFICSNSLYQEYLMGYRTHSPDNIAGNIPSSPIQYNSCEQVTQHAEPLNTNANPFKAVCVSYLKSEHVVLGSNDNNDNNNNNNLMFVNNV